MKTFELIRLLKAADPSGHDEVKIRAGQLDVLGKTGAVTVMKNKRLQGCGVRHEVFEPWPENDWHGPNMIQPEKPWPRE